MWPAQAPPITRLLTSKLQAPVVPNTPSSPVRSADALTFSQRDSCDSRSYLWTESLSNIRYRNLPPAPTTHGSLTLPIFRSSIPVEMTTVMVFIQRCMVLFVIFLCYFHVRGEGVDCELYPFHHTCRGTMSRKRAMIPILYASGCEGSKGNLNCVQEFGERRFVPYIPLSKSKLLISLLDRDLRKDVTFAVRHRQRKDEMDERRTPLMENFLSELESSDSSY